MSVTPEFAKMIPELEAWNNGEGIDIESWIRCVGRFDHAVGYAQIFWPQFTIHDGCILFAGFQVESFDAWMNQTSGQRRQVEAVMNHRHILDLFFGDETEVPREMVVHLGRTLREMWTAKLTRDFPNREIEVSFPEERYDDLLDYQITVCHKELHAS